jgi:hypothetical protein
MVKPFTDRHLKRALKTIDPVHHKGVKIALRVFVIFRTENALCEAGPIRHFFMDQKIQEEYAMKTSTPQPIFMKAIETFGKQATPVYARPPWLANKNETIDLTMCATPKGVKRERIPAKFTSLMADKYGEHERMYTRVSHQNHQVRFSLRLSAFTNLQTFTKL